MIKFEHREEIERPINDVFEYLTNIENWPNWSGDFFEVHKISEGPIGIGTKFNTSVRVMGRNIESTLRIDAYELDRNVSLKTVSGPVDGLLHCNFESADGGTKLTVSAQGEMGGFYKLVEPMVDDLVQRQYKAVFAMLKAILEA